MSGFFNIESPFMQGLNKLADLIILNLLALVCCLPVITAGASITALHYMCLKIVRDEETYVIKGFFKSFKQNFRQATIIWIIELLIALLLLLDVRILMNSGIQFPTWLPIALLAVAGIVFMLGLHVFPLLAKFDNTVFVTIKNSVLVGILTFPKTILMTLICLLPVALIYFFDTQAFPIIILIGFSGPAFLCALLYNKTFKKFEPQDDNANPDDWYVEPVEEGETAESVKSPAPEDPWAKLSEEVANDRANETKE